MIWVHLEGVARPSDVRIVETEYVSTLCKAIKVAFAPKLDSTAAPNLVVRAPDTTFPLGTDPKSVDPTAFKKVLGNPKATLAAVLKPTIEGEKGEYEVYVELPAKPREEATSEKRKRPGYEVINTLVPPEYLVAEDKASSHQNREYYIAPSRVTSWKGFETEVTGFDLRPIVPGVIDRLLMPSRVDGQEESTSEADVDRLFTQFVANPLNQMLKGTDVVIGMGDVPVPVPLSTSGMHMPLCPKQDHLESKREPTPDKADHGIYFKKQLIIIMDNKRLSFDNHLQENAGPKQKAPRRSDLDPKKPAGTDLVDAFNNSRQESVEAAICQIFQHLCYTNLQYGILNCYSSLWCIRRVKDTLQVSPRILREATNPSQLQCIAYLIALAKPDSSSSFSSSSSSLMLEDEHALASSSSSSTKQFDCTSSSDEDVDAFDRTTPPPQPEAPFTVVKSSLLGNSRCGSVWELLGKAVKLVLMGSEMMEELQHEARVYESLSKLQGKTIPVASYAGPMQKGTVYGLIMSLAGCNLFSLSPDQRRQFKRSALQALESLHAENWLHGDVKLSNFVLAKSRNPAAIVAGDHVLVIDLGFAERSDDPAAKEKERNQLRNCFR